MSESKKANLFAKLAQQNANLPQAEPEALEPVADAARLPPAPPAAAKPKAEAGRKKGEPPAGKRTNPAYCQANAYILKSVRRDVDRALLDLEGKDYSTLVEELLTKWLKSRRVAE